MYLSELWKIGFLFWIGFYIWMFAEFVIMIRNRRLRKNVSATRKDRGSLILILVGIWFGIEINFYLHTLQLVEVSLGIYYLGFIMMITGVLFRIWAIRMLGQHFSLSVSLDVNHTIFQKGPYKFIRHPSYAGSLITFIGVGLSLNTWLGLCASLVVFFLSYEYRIRIEEGLLAPKFEDAYEAYRKRTWKFVPFLY